MKIQLDTDKKTIKLEDNVKLSKLIDTLKKLLPNNEWREFTLETNTTIQSWTSPIVIHEHHDHRPYWGPWYAATNHNASYAVKKTMGNTQMSLRAGGTADKNDQLQLKSGVYNVEI